LPGVHDLVEGLAADAGPEVEQCVGWQVPAEPGVRPAVADGADGALAVRDEPRVGDQHQQPGSLTGVTDLGEELLVGDPPGHGGALLPAEPVVAEAVAAGLGLVGEESGPVRGGQGVGEGAGFGVGRCGMAGPHRQLAFAPEGHQVGEVGQRLCGCPAAAVCARLTPALDHAVAAFAGAGRCLSQAMTAAAIQTGPGTTAMRAASPANARVTGASAAGAKP